MDLIAYNKFTLKMTSKHANNYAVRMLDIFKDKCIEKGVFTQNDYRLMRKVASSDHLQKVYRQQQLKTYIAPKMFDIQRKIGDKMKRCRFSQISLKSLCKKYLKNKHLVRRIISEMDSEPQQHSDSCYYSRIHGKLKLELYLDEAEIAPTGKYFNVQSLPSKLI